MTGYIFFRILIFLIGLIPYRLLYILSNGLAWVLRVVVSYRMDVIEKNLDYALPELDEKKRQSVIKKIYRNLTDIILESIKSYTSSIEEVNKRYQFLNPEELIRHYNAGKDLTLFGGHYNNWEWGTITFRHQLPLHVVALMKPLKNKKIHNYIWRERSKIGTELVSIYDVKKSALHTQGQPPKAIVFVADQNPSKASTALDVTFLGNITKAMKGGESYARKYETPVYYMAVDRVKRGYYTVTPILITETPSLLPMGEITQQFYDHLAEQIIENPGSWLWTHKRWKREGLYRKTTP